MKYTINNIQFKTDKELQACAKKNLYTGDLNSLLEGDELKFMTEYFESIHHEWIDKKGVGLSRIRRIRDKVYGKYRAFQIERVDNSITDISYIISNIKAPRVDKDFKQALRWVIEPQILEFKKKTFALTDTMICSISGQSIRFDNCHVDHTNPTFDEIVTNFIRNHNLTDLSKFVTISRDNQSKAELSDEAMKRLFFDYHKSVANLCCVSQNANLTKKKQPQNK